MPCPARQCNNQRGHCEKEEKKWIIKLKVDIDTPIVVFSPEAPKIAINLGKCDGSISRKCYMSSGIK